MVQAPHLPTLQDTLDGEVMKLKWLIQPSDIKRVKRLLARHGERCFRQV